MKKIYTLAYLRKEGVICLAMKKRGFGEGNWNGYGGKLEEGESVEEATVREIGEESGVVVAPENLTKVAVVEFFFHDGKHLEVHTFFVDTWEGEPVETEEMHPQWFLHEDIPFEKMWADDEYWLPRALKGEKFLGKVWFQKDGTSIEKMEWESVFHF
jgi:ADP-ribose pyrophosphatase YjhB (NUDIX family)